jgi:prepilin-type processing-associated H-X9-DG protein
MQTREASETVGHEPVGRRRDACSRSSGFSIAELLVVIGIIALLIAILLPVISRVRKQSQRTTCAANLYQLGKAFSVYAAENRGFVPRYGRYANEPGFFGDPIWLAEIGRILKGSAKLEWEDLPKMAVLQCPSHPTEKIPSAFVVNAFDFATESTWSGARATQISRIKKPSTVPWALDCSDQFGEATYGPYDGIFFEPYHTIRKPEHLTTRVSWTRHAGKTFNVLYADWHVETLDTPIALEQFDDGIR